MNFSTFYIKILMQKTFEIHSMIISSRSKPGEIIIPGSPRIPLAFLVKIWKIWKIRSEKYVLLALILFQMYWNEFKLLGRFEVQLWSSKCKTSFDQYFYSMLRSALSIPFMSPLGYKLLRLEAPPVTSPLVYQPLSL